MLFAAVAVLILFIPVVFGASGCWLLVTVARLPRASGHARQVALARLVILVTAVAVTGAATVYGYADLMYAPGLFPDKTCGLRAGAWDYPISHGAFPLSTVCPGAAGGDPVEIVPGWVNPTVIMLLLLSVVSAGCVPLAMVARRRVAGRVRRAS